MKTNEAHPAAERQEDNIGGLLEEIDGPWLVTVPIYVGPKGFMPEYATPGSVGMDIRVADDVEVTREPTYCPTDLHFAIPEGYELQIRARSGLAKTHGIQIVQGIGTIDQDYRGEVGVLLRSVNKDEVVFNRGDRIAQAVLVPVPRANLWPVESVEALGKTKRGSGGFGSTGVD